MPPQTKCTTGDQGKEEFGGHHDQAERRPLRPWAARGVRTALICYSCLMIDTPIGRAHGDPSTLAAWEAHCARIAQRVAAGELCVQEAAPLCDTRAFVHWMQLALANANTALPVPPS